MSREAILRLIFVSILCIAGAATMLSMPTNRVLPCEKGVSKCQTN